MCWFLQEVCMMDWQLTYMWGRSPLQLSGCYQVLSPTGDTQLILPQCSHICIFSWHISLSLSFSFSSQRAELADGFNKGHSGNEHGAWRWLSGGVGFRAGKPQATRYEETMGSSRVPQSLHENGSIRHGRFHHKHERATSGHHSDLIHVHL